MAPSVSEVGPFCRKGLLCVAFVKTKFSGGRSHHSPSRQEGPTGVSLAVGPVSGPTLGMGHGDNGDAAAVFTKDHLERIMPHEEVAMPRIAHRKLMRIQRNGFQCVAELGFESFSRLNASHSIPA